MFEKCHVRVLGVSECQESVQQKILQKNWDTLKSSVGHLSGAFLCPESVRHWYVAFGEVPVLHRCQTVRVVSSAGVGAT